MTSFNEWLSQRDTKVYSEMFDKPTEYPLIDGGFFEADMEDANTVAISLTPEGKNKLKNMTSQKFLNKDLLDKFGNELIGVIKEMPFYHDVDVTELRDDLKMLAPQAEMALDAVLKRFATRTGRKLGNNGNLLFTKNSALRQLKQDPSISKTGRFDVRPKERESEAAKQEKLAHRRQSIAAGRSLLDS